MKHSRTLNNSKLKEKIEMSFLALASSVFLTLGILLIVQPEGAPGFLVTMTPIFFIGGIFLGFLFIGTVIDEAAEKIVGEIAKLKAEKEKRVY